MGDLLEFTTRMKCGLLFYKVDSGAILLSIKGDNNAVMGLSDKPSLPCMYWVHIGTHGYAYIKKDKKCVGRVNTLDLLSRDEYGDFWLAWNNGRIRFGLKSQTKALLSMKIEEKSLCYITFTTTEQAMDMKWKCLLPPQIEKPLVAKLSGREPQWIPVIHQLPDESLIGGFEKETLYIIRAPHQGSLTPGKFVPSQGAGFIPWGGASHEKLRLEVLCGYNCIWQKTSKDIIPVGAVEGGYSEDYEKGKLYVGRAEIDGYLIPGKVQPSHNVCYIPYKGQEIAICNYEILVVPHTNTRCAGANYVAEVGMEDINEIIPAESESEDDV